MKASRSPPHQSIVHPDICLGHKDCIPMCRFQAIQARKDATTGEVRAFVDPDRCTGCGQCVLGCTVEGTVRLVLRERQAA